MQKYLLIFTVLASVFFQLQSKVFAEFVGEASQNPAVPTTSEWIETQPVPNVQAVLPTSESFLASHTGLSRVVDETEKEREESAESADQKALKVSDLRKNENTYDKQKCEEMPGGWTCAAFYIGGNKKQETTFQESSEGDSEKGSSWKNHTVTEWDLAGRVVKNETTRVQEEWNNDEEKGYHYLQRYKNGILEYENYRSVNDQEKQGIMLEYGKL